MNDDGESFYDCGEVRGADDEWEKGWTTTGVIEAFHPDGVGEWGPPPPRYGGILHCTERVEASDVGRPVTVLDGQSRDAAPVLDGPGRPDGLLPRRRLRTGQQEETVTKNGMVGITPRRGPFPLAANGRWRALGEFGLTCCRAVLALNALWAGTGTPGELLEITLETFEDPWKGVPPAGRGTDAERKAWRHIEQEVTAFGGESVTTGDF